MHRNARGAFPTWAKIVIGAVILIVGMIVGLTIAAGLFVKNLNAKSSDPKYEKEVASEIATFSDPMPAGFSFRNAVQLMMAKEVSVKHTPEKMDILFTEIDVSESQKPGLQNNFKNGRHAVLFKATDSGTVTVADHILEYRLGYTNIRTSGGGNKFAILDGIINDIPNRYITVNAYSDGQKPFDLALFKTFTDSIKSLEPKLEPKADTKKAS